MATDTLLQIISNPNIFSPLISGVIAAVVALGGQYYFFQQNKEKERYQKLYGPLKFNLLMMKLIFENEKEVADDIKKYFNPEIQGGLMMKHLSPLGKKWLNHRDNIKNLFEKNTGLINKDDFNLVSDFMDSCIKREIIEEGKNILAIDVNRINKLLETVKNLQNELL